MSYLTMAVKLHQENPELNLSFYNFSDYFWSFDGDSILYSDLAVDILEDTGNGMCLEVRYKVEQDDQFIKFYVDNGCGEKYDAVFDKSKRLEVE